MTKRFLLTGGAGFIGSNLAEHLIRAGHSVVVLDNFDPFYDPRAKRANIAGLMREERFRLIEADILDLEMVEAALSVERDNGGFDAIIHLAARAGVRPSLQEAQRYMRTNVEGTAAMLELARRLDTRSFVHGSSSSVYGDRATTPFTETDSTDAPISPYAATKCAAELVCRTYHHLYAISVVCLRFFTVYGPRQRPDLAIHKFARLMLDGNDVPLYGDGSTERDYTHVTDIIRGIEGAIHYLAANRNTFEIINLGGSRTTSLRRLVALLGTALEIRPRIVHSPAQPGDVRCTYADVAKAGRLLGYSPTVGIEEGIDDFAAWIRSAHPGRRTVRSAGPSRIQLAAPISSVGAS